MIRKINVGNKDEDFKCSAATSILYKRLFGISLTTEITKLVSVTKSAEEVRKKLSNLQGQDLVELLANDTSLLDLTNTMTQIVPQMAYIMWLEANKPQKEVFKGLTQEDYILWLSEYESNDLVNASGEFMDLWNATDRTYSSLKNQ